MEELEIHDVSAVCYCSLGNDWPLSSHLKFLRFPR